MKILLLRTWTTNIGNGFIDKGSKAQLSKSFPDADIVETSAYNNWAADKRDQKILSSGDQLSRSVHLSKYIDADVAVLSGCVLSPLHLSRFKKAFTHLRDSNIPLIIMGAGGGDYTKKTQKEVRDQFNKINPHGLLTRDTEAYNAYSNLVNQSYDGIDSAFFISDWYTPPSSKSEFDVITFDKRPEPEIETDNEVVRADHFPFERPHTTFLNKVKKNRNQSRFFKKENTYVSDTLEDYLFLYANAKKVYSDRVHACVPTLTYGNKARFWHETPRDGLFEKVMNKDYKSSPVSLDLEKLEEKKNKQVEKVREVIKDCIN